MALPTKEFHELVKQARSGELYGGCEQREVVWKEYNAALLRQVREILLFIRDEVDAVKLPDKFVHKGPGRPRTSAHSLAKAVLACEYMHLPERQAQAWMGLLGPLLGIKEELDDWVIGDAYGRPDVQYILNELFERSKSSDGVLSGDGTHVEQSRKENYESKKSSATGGWLTTIIDSREFVQAFNDDAHEFEAMLELIPQVDGDSLRLDAGFLSRDVTNLASDYGLTPYIHPKSNTSMARDGSASWQHMLLDFTTDPVLWLFFYHLRSHCESFHSSYKRCFGHVTKRNDRRKHGQTCARLTLHNEIKSIYWQNMPAN